jgi:hypothetical protein
MWLYFEPMVKRIMQVGKSLGLASDRAVEQVAMLRFVTELINDFVESKQHVHGMRLCSDVSSCRLLLRGLWSRAEGYHSHLKLAYQDSGVRFSHHPFRTAPTVYYCLHGLNSGLGGRGAHDLEDCDVVRLEK